MDSVKYQIGKKLDPNGHSVSFRQYRFASHSDLLSLQVNLILHQVEAVLIFKIITLWHFCVIQSNVRINISAIHVSRCQSKLTFEKTIESYLVFCFCYFLFYVSKELLWPMGCILFYRKLKIVSSISIQQMSNKLVGRTETV